ncbi:MAG: N-acetyl-gamma-glutamyl-phosphate reductase [Candidatus Caenarcaniphilales bacterium]|nr:N-acetyl-gamma-glutamyl-phosphate reductase [Candidatus Caenarcaniphilales bacterium]
MSKKIKVGIMGVTGYSGTELLRLLLRHQQIEIVALFSSSRAGERFEKADLSFLPWSDRLPTLIGETETPELDCLFTATPNGIAGEIADAWLRRGAKLIDLAADFRLKSATTYQTWYQPLKAAEPALLGQAVYGLTELNRPQLKGAKLIANPGCYPTAAALSLVPLFKAGLVESDFCIVDAKSGTTGAGKKAEERLLHAEVSESFGAYGVVGHRHTPEIEQSLALFAGKEVKVRFTPHLLPIKRGLQTTSYLKLIRGSNSDQAIGVLKESYAAEPFVHYTDRIPTTKDVTGTNHCLIHTAYDERTGLLTVISVIDNLFKGAAGQALQNFNLAFDLVETIGL